MMAVIATLLILLSSLTILFGSIYYAIAYVWNIRTLIGLPTRTVCLSLLPLIGVGLGYAFMHTTDFLSKTRDPDLLTQLLCYSSLLMLPLYIAGFWWQRKALRTYGKLYIGLFAPAAVISLFLTASLLLTASALTLK